GDPDIFPTELSDIFLASDKEVLTTKKSTVLHFITKHLEEQKNIMTVKSPILDSNGDIIGILGNSRDITESEKIKIELEESNAILNMMFEHAPDPLFVKDLNGVYTQVNAAFADFHGVTVRDVEGKTDEDLFEPEIAKRFKIEDRRILGTGRVEVDEISLFINNKNRTTRVTKGPLFSKNYEPMGVMGIVHDITYNKQVEAKLRESQKMDSIGNLAGGIAHDLNNTLSGVMGYASILRAQETSKENKEYLEKVINASERAARLIDRLQTFTKKQVDQLINVDLNSIVQDTYEMLNPSLRSKIEITLDLDNEIYEIDGDPTQISQVVMNLMINAIDAVENYGSITISTETCDVNDLDQFTIKSDKMIPGKFVKMRVQDTGKGIPEDSMSNILEPFYTTKKEGEVKGSGLGLTIVYNVVTNHGGIIDIESTVNKGTNFDIYFPMGNLISDQKIQDTKVEEKLNLGLILIVEDEIHIRTILEKMLTILGYTTISAVNGLEGVKIFKDKSDEIDMVILDMVMPEMDGKDAFLQMKLIDPHVKVIISSGYNKEKYAEILDLGVASLLEKPYSIDTLSKVLTNVLGS
ncbi:MAG: PAS domain-containing protein, partial [Candidatus Kariarchaeaceae archaeon]